MTEPYLKVSQKTLIRDFLEDRAWQGVHTLECRKAGYSGNPSERFRELAADGVSLRKRRERLDGKWGVRVWLARFAPADTELIPYDPDFSDSELDRSHSLSSVRGQAAVELGAGAPEGGDGTARSVKREAAGAEPAELSSQAVVALSARRKPAIATAYLYEQGQARGKPGEPIRCLPWSAVCALTGAHEAEEVTEAEAKRILDTECEMAVAA